MMKRLSRIWWPAVLCVGVAALVWGQDTIWRTDGTSVTEGALTTGDATVIGDLSLTGSTNRTVSIGDGILTLSTNNPNQAFLNATGFWFLRVGDVDKINLSAGAVVVNEAGADVNFRVESDAKPNAFFLEGSSANVGIGGVPGSKLHVFGSTGEIMRLEQTGTGSPPNFIRWIDIRGQTAHLGHGSSATDDFFVTNQTATGKLILRTFNTTALTIDSNQDAVFAQTLGITDILTIAAKASAPGTCVIGDFYVDSSGAACACSATNTWSNMHATGSCA